MTSNDSPSYDRSTHSEPIIINTNNTHRNRPRSASDSSSEDSLPSLSPTSESPESAPSTQTPSPSNSRLSVAPVPPSSPILSYFYGGPNKNPFTGAPTSNKVFEDEDTREPSPPLGTHPRRMSASWAPVRFGAQQNVPGTESQQDRGVGILRRLSLSSSNVRPFVPGQGRSTTPPNSPDGGGTAPPRKPSPRIPGQHRKAATLSAGNIDPSKVPRAPSPMGERILKGFFDGF